MTVIIFAFYWLCGFGIRHLQMYLCFLSGASCSLCGIFKETIFAGDQFPVICDRKVYYLLKKYHVIIIKEDGQQGIYNMGKRLNALLPVVQGGGKIKSLGDWWILIKEHNIIGG
jgi:hypothetical protein